MRSVIAIVGMGIGPWHGSALLPSSDRAALEWCAALAPFRAYVPAGQEQARRYALAAGAQEVLEYTNVGDIDGGFDVAIFGEGGCGIDGDRLPAELAVHNHAALLCEILELRATPNNLRVIRDATAGASDEFELQSAAVLVAAESARARRYVSTYRQRQAGAQPSTATASSTDTSHCWQKTIPRVRTGQLDEFTAGGAADRLNAHIGATGQEDAGSVIRGDAKTCAAHLIRYLCHHGFIEKSSDIPEVETVLGSPTQIQATRSRAEEQLVSRRQRRGPRPVEGECRGMARRPRGLGEQISAPQPTRRRPQLLDGNTPRFRGPYPLTTAA